MPEAAARDAATPAAPQILLGVDFGLRRIGLAVGDTVTRRARPRPAVQVPAGREPDEAAFACIARELRDSGATRIVVGCPYNSDGTRSALAIKASQFADELGRRHRLPVHRVDERYSSIEATEVLRGLRADGTRRGRVAKTDVDSAAAAVILERWMAGEGDQVNADPTQC